MVTDCVAKMIAFKARHPAVTFDLTPIRFTATIPGQEPMSAVSLCRLMDKLEQWEQADRT